MMDAIKQLRERSGAGMNDVKRALDATNGDQDAALDFLRKEGKKIAQKKAERVTREGVIESYVHANGKVASLVSVACETDFVARNEQFREFVHDLALHVTAMNPTYVSRADVPADILERETALLKEQVSAEGKPEKIAEQIVQGRLEKFYAEQCLLDQPFVKDDTKTIKDLLEEMIAKIGEKIEIRQFVRFSL